MTKNTGDELATAAARLIGVRFRLHGRNPASGLDCVGVLTASLEAMGRAHSAPIGYRLHNIDSKQWLRYALRSGLVDAKGAMLPGDVLLVAPGPAQQHLMIVETKESAIHAHATLGRVVRQPIDKETKILAHWRLNSCEVKD